jgi:hypothetical protein
MINFDALTVQLNDLRARFSDSRSTTSYGKIGDTANDLFHMKRRFPESVRTDYIEEMISDKFQELKALLESTDLDDVDAIAESKLEGKDRLTESSILSKEGFQKLLDKAFNLDDAGLDVFDHFEELIIEAANSQNQGKLDFIIEEYISTLLGLAGVLIWKKEEDKMKAIEAIESNAINLNPDPNSADFHAAAPGTEQFDYELEVLTAAAEAGDAEAAKVWLNHCAELDAIVTEPNDNLRKAVQALSDAGMLFNYNTDETFYLTEGADIQLSNKSITLTDEEMNKLIRDNF